MNYFDDYRLYCGTMYWYINLYVQNTGTVVQYELFLALQHGNAAPELGKRNFGKTSAPIF